MSRRTLARAQRTHYPQRCGSSYRQVGAPRLTYAGSSTRATPPSRGPVRIDLDWDALEIAVERNSPDTDSYLDLTTGRVLTITTGDPEAAINRQQVSENIRNFLRVEPASSREQYRWMERFVGSVVDEPLRERLIISIDGKGAFRRFKDVLLAYPAERERWFSYRADLLHWHIQQLARAARDRADQRAAVGPGRRRRRSCRRSAGPVVHGTEAPGEALRRQARDLIETIPAIELPTAIAFLEFLKQRSAERSRSRPIGRRRPTIRHDVTAAGDRPTRTATCAEIERCITRLVQEAPALDARGGRRAASSGCARVGSPLALSIARDRRAGRRGAGRRRASRCRALAMACATLVDGVARQARRRASSRPRATRSRRCCRCPTGRATLDRASLVAPDVPVVALSRGPRRRT